MKKVEQRIKKFLIKSPCDKFNGKGGYLYSLAVTDNNGNIIYGLGDHIDRNPYYTWDSNKNILIDISDFVIQYHNNKRRLSPKHYNVYKMEGESYSDDGRPISIMEVNFDIYALKEIKRKLLNSYDLSIEWHRKEKEALGDFESWYDFVYSFPENKQKERIRLKDKFFEENPRVITCLFYNYLNLLSKDDKFKAGIY